MPGHRHRDWHVDADHADFNTPAELARIAKAYHVFYQKVPIDGGDYVVDHTATVFLMDAEGRFFSTLDHKEGEAPKLAKLRRLVTS